MSEFDSIIVCDSADELQALLPKLKDFKGYTVKEVKGDWVNLLFGGTDDGGPYPHDYMELHDYLTTNGFVQKRSYWGSRRFEKKPKETKAEEQKTK